MTGTVDAVYHFPTLGTLHPSWLPIVLRAPQHFARVVIARGHDVALLTARYDRARFVRRDLARQTTQAERLGRLVGIRVGNHVLPIVFQLGTNCSHLGHSQASREIARRLGPPRDAASITRGGAAVGV